MVHVFLKKSPFIRLLLPLISGLFVSLHIEIPIVVTVIAAALVFISFALLTYYLKVNAAYRYRNFIGFSGLLMFFLISIIYSEIRLPVIIDSNSKTELKVKILSNLGQTEKNDKYEVICCGHATDTLKQCYGLRGIIYLPHKNSSFKPQPGDQLFVQGQLMEFTKASNQFDFDYSWYLRNQRIGFRLLVKDYSKINVKKDYSLPIISALLKDELKHRYMEAGMSESQLAVLNALFLGDKSLLTYEQKSAFSDAGAMHLLAVSGLHVGIIYMLLIGVIQSVGFKKKTFFSALIIIIVLWIYAFITGFSPSVLRASLMFSILEIGRISNRQTGIFNLLGASMFIILVIEPLSVFNIGFWLSHCAVASIVCFYPRINAWFHFKFLPFKWIWSIIAVSLAAQLGTLPISIYTFHEFPLYFIITNVILIPIVSPILILSVFSSILAFSSFGLNLLVPALADLIGFMEQTAVWIDSLPYSTISNLFISWFEMMMVFICIIFLLLYIDYRFTKYLRHLLIVLAAILLSIHIRHLNKPQEILFVANVKGKSVVNYISGDENTIYSSAPLTEKEIDFAFKGVWAYMEARLNYEIVLLNHQQNSRPIVKLIGNQTVVLVPTKAQWNYQLNNAHVDLLVLFGAPDMNLKDLRKTMRIKELVIAGGWAWYSKKKWLKGYAQHVDKLHDVKNDGVLFVGLDN